MLALALLACTAEAPDTAAEAEPEPPWPEWAFHHWVWEDESTQDSALTLVRDYLDRDIPVGAIIIDSPWATGYNTFQWDPERFPDPQGMIDELHGLGVRVFLWIVPAINVEEVELWAYADERQWFMQDAAGSGSEIISWWKGEGSLLDYFNPEAVDWWHGMMDPVLAMGIDGWKCDGLDFSALLAPYSPGAGRSVDRLEYSHAYYQDFHDYTRAALGEDRIITARPVDNYGFGIGGDDVAFAPREINWAGWVGDQDPDFSGLRAALDNYYYSADYGYVAFGSDIGGYRSDDSALGRDRESFLRWAQLGALSPVMENGGSGEHRPWAFDTVAEAIYRDFVRLHYALLPYLMAEGGRAFAEGRSLLDFQDDEGYAYLLGPDVFVAPVLEAGGEVAITFPEGDWSYLFDRDRGGSGGEEAVWTVPIDEYPVFLRAGSELAEDLDWR